MKAKRLKRWLENVSPDAIIEVWNGDEGKYDPMTKNDIRAIHEMEDGEEILIAKEPAQEPKEKP